MNCIEGLNNLWFAFVKNLHIFIHTNWGQKVSIALANINRVGSHYKCRMVSQSKQKNLFEIKIKEQLFFFSFRRDHNSSLFSFPGIESQIRCRSRRRREKAKKKIDGCTYLYPFESDSSIWDLSSLHLGCWTDPYHTLRIILAHQH